MTTIMSQMINTISLILSAFAGISLIVSSIMIGILTYVSVVERTKEIGILRAIGARKKRYHKNLYRRSRVNRIYFWCCRCSGDYALSIPISRAVAKGLEVESFTASLSAQASIGLIALSFSINAYC